MKTVQDTANEITQLSRDCAVANPSRRAEASRRRVEATRFRSVFNAEMFEVGLERQEPTPEERIESAAKCRKILQ